MKAVIVGITSLISFFSLLAVVIAARQFGFNPSNFHDPAMVFDPLTLTTTVLILTVPIIITVAAQKFVLRERLGTLIQGPVLKPAFVGLAIGLSLKIIATAIAYILSPSASASLVNISVSIAFYLPYFAFFVFTLIFNSLSEELVYRAFPLQVLWKNDSRFLIWLGFATAILFSLAHFLIEEPDLIRFVYRFSFGFLASLIFIQSRSLWKIVGLHTGWNFIALSVGDSQWQTGGILHLENLTTSYEGVANSVVLLLASGLLIAVKKHRRIKI